MTGGVRSARLWLSPVIDEHHSDATASYFVAAGKDTQYSTFYETIPWADLTDPAEKALYRQGFMSVRACTPACPNGEGGCTHLCNMLPLTEEQFEGARDRGWDDTYFFLHSDVL